MKSSTPIDADEIDDLDAEIVRKHKKCAAHAEVAGSHRVVQHAQTVHIHRSENLLRACTVAKAATKA